MVSFSSLFLASAVVAGVSAFPFSNLTVRSTGQGTGTDGGYYYSYWNSGSADVTFNLLGGGGYSVTWTNNVGNFVAGKGWNPGSGQ
jgi:endo-1,4-beta-xylanase